MQNWIDYILYMNKKDLVLNNLQCHKIKPGLSILADFNSEVVVFYGVSTLFRSFNAKLNFKQFSIV